MMLDLYGLTLLLLPIAAASGWYVARRGMHASAGNPSRTAVGSTPIEGVNYLANDDPDKAIDVFVHLTEVDNDTVETHMALGNLFRRRGEVDRALRIHQNLVSRPNLKAVHRQQARFELGSDYLRAGVLDRAEALFQDLVGEGLWLEAALQNLLTIYEKERDWRQAIDTAQQLETVTGQTQRGPIAHYWCELAQEAARRQERAEARKHLRKALSHDRDCVRASLLRGQLGEETGDYGAAIKSYTRVMQQNSDYLTEILEPLRRCFHALDAPDAWRDFLSDAARSYQGVAPHVAIARLLHESQQGEAATEHLAGYLEHFPSWLGFYQLLELTAANSDDGLSGPLDSLRHSLHHMMETAARYQCTHCGFSGRALHWQCPGCLHWNSVRPLKDLKPATS